MSKTNVNDPNEIILGSGDLYMVEFSGSTIPDDKTIETEDNRAGNIQGGASLEYKADTKQVSDDQGHVRKTIITKETVTMKTGLITWCPAWVQAVIQTARVDESTKPGHRIYKIGGLGNRNKKNYLYRFVHTRDDGRKLRLTVTGKNTGTAGLKFDPEKETALDAEITADPLDTEGTLVILDDEQPANSLPASDPAM